MMENVYLVFEEIQRSCDRDYGDDGYMIIWDSDEVGRNLTVEQLSNEIKKCDEDLYNLLIKHMREKLQLDDFGMADDYLTEIMEYLTEETEGIMYMFYYQNIFSVKEVHATEESAKSACDYYNKNIAYKNKFTHTRYSLLGLNTGNQNKENEVKKVE